MSLARHRDAWTLLIAILGAVLAGVIAPRLDHIALKSIAYVIVILGLAVVLRKEWGAVGVAGIPFLLPSLRTRFGIPGSLQLAILTLIAAIIYWDTLGRPRISIPALFAAIVFALVTLLLTVYYKLGVSLADWLAVLPFAGIIFGSCLSSSEAARTAFGYGCLPLALLALTEIAGVPNPWPKLVHATEFLAVSQKEGAHRAQSTFGHPLIAGACLATAAMVMQQSRTRFSGPVAAVLACGALATVSRSAILGLAVGVAVGLLMSRQRLRYMAQAVLAVAVAIVLIAEIPALGTSIGTRLSGSAGIASDSLSYSDQPVRAFAVHKITTDFSAHTGALVLGDGVGSTAKMLAARGGIYGYNIFDNQYITSIYDMGILPMVVVAMIVAYAIYKADPAARHLGLPALAAVAPIMLFVDGGYWVSLCFTAWLTVGLASAPAAARSRQS